MSGSSESDISHRSGGNSDRDSDSEGSAASSLLEKKPRTIQIRGGVWVLRGEITTNLLHNYTSLDGDGQDADDDAKVQNTKSQIESALDAKFEGLFEKMLGNIKYFVLLCNLVQILQDGHAAATKVKIQIRGFLQSGKVRSSPGAERRQSCSLARAAGGLEQADRDEM